MAEKSGGSDLDVFEGLAKKSRPSGAPAGPASVRTSNAPPPPPPGGARPLAKTMLGVAPPPGGAPSVSVAKSGPPGPPPSRTSGSLPAVAAPAAPTPSARPLPPVLPPPSPSRPPSAGQLPPVTAPPPRNAAAKAAKAAAAGGAAVEMDWDDEDEKTNIFDQKGTEEAVRALSEKPPLPAPKGPPDLPPPSARPSLGAAAKLAGSSGGVASTPPPMLPPPSVPPPLSRPALPAAQRPASGALPAVRPPTTGSGLPPVQAPPPSVAAVPAASAPQTSRTDTTQVVRAQRSGSGAVVALLLLVVVLAGVAIYLIQPTTGVVIVSVKSGGRAVEKAQILLDEKKVCDSAPCRIADVPKGARTVKVFADGYANGVELVGVRAGEESPLTVNLEKATPPSQGTGIRVAGAAAIKLSIDGKELGPLPQEIKDMTPGDHKVKFAEGERYATDERTVTIVQDQMQTLSPPNLKVLKGVLTLTIGTPPDARVSMVAGTERRAIKTFPVTVEVDTSRGWGIEATHVGYDDLKQPITFDDGQAEKTIAINLNLKGKTPATPPADTSTPTTPNTAAPPATTAPPPPDAGGNGTLSINSIPPSNCILDGRPLGMTPKGGLSVSAGVHTVTFIHPEFGKKSTSVTVKAGETKAAAVRFPLALSGK